MRGWSRRSRRGFPAGTDTAFAARETTCKLTNHDLDIIQGRAEQLVGRVQERYGVARAEAERQVKDWMSGVKSGRRPRLRGSGSLLAECG